MVLSAQLQREVELTMMFERLSDAEKLSYENRMCSQAEIIHLKEEYDWSPESSDQTMSKLPPVGGALGIGVVALAADQTLAPGLLFGLKGVILTVGVLTAKVAIMAGVAGVVVYLLIPKVKKETH